MDINTIWQLIAPYFTGISIGGIISTILGLTLKSQFSKAMSKVNVEKIAKTAVNVGTDKLKSTTFKHDIQPLVESKLKEIQEKANELTTAQLILMEAKYDKLIKVLECFAQYFDNSVGVPESAKENLKKAIELAKNEPELTVESVVVEEQAKTETKTPKTNNISVDR